MYIGPLALQVIDFISFFIFLQGEILGSLGGPGIPAQPFHPMKKLGI
jgi:hypothetical protein